MYELGALYCVRLAGVPFEILDDLGAPHLASLVTEVFAIEHDLDAAKAAAKDAMRDLNRAVRGRAKKALARGVALPADVGSHPTFDAYAALVERLAQVRATLDAQLAAADEAARRALWSHARTVLPDFLAIESDSAYRELTRYADSEQRPDAAKVRYTERALARYLQRVAAKNDTISRFGPTVWGRIDPQGTGFELAMKPGIAKRWVGVERWVVRAILAAMNRDAAVRAELCPRLHPNGRLDGATFVRLDKLDATPQTLGAADLDVLARCDGATPAYQLDTAKLEALASAGVVIWEAEPVAFDHDPLTSLREDVARWRDGEAKQRWTACLDTLFDATRRFANLDATQRRTLTDQVLELVEKLGGAPPRTGALSRASNPIVEECAREGRVELGGVTLGKVVEEIEPWLDLFADTYALAASRAYGRLCELLATAPRRGEGISLPAFAAHCDANGFALREGGLGKLARATFDEVKRDFAARFASRADAPEWELTREDCHFLRAKHALPPPGDQGWACPDMQIAASSPEDVAAGNCTWVVAELHGVMAPAIWAIAWSCPDPAALSAIYGGTEPWLLPSLVAAMMASAHTSIEPMLTTIPHARFSMPERVRPTWRFVAPSETEVVAVHDIQDIRVRARGTGEDLGSLVRTQWLVGGGLHPFFPLELAPHTPRLRVGRAIVQRRNWRVTREELAVSLDQGLTSKLLLAVARLRAARGIPRWVYVRPAPGLIDHSRVLARIPDVKPMYIDLESTIFLEIFCRHLEKYGALEVAEMLPSPEQLCWREPDGRYSFELRMLMPPRRASR